jgi:threonine dehydratase
MSIATEASAGEQFALREVVRPYIRVTEASASNRLHLELELLQCTGCFKARGVFANLIRGGARCRRARADHTAITELFASGGSERW